ncbi:MULTISPECIES: protein-tyrosine phosphatase family protein [Streptomyces]|uniref:protein-tyrosine phosphatase family protein n=1 Tax=Streptomyces TaxID=1883 RepID=UPI0022702DD6|nr:MULTISPECIES: protein phosphatase [unclassified Streptomyces]MCY0940979.1 protein phosphatase [Streptomyces sp. H34-AA3]MCY0949520.1 protein phosphatase [Streptomyces sp. H27-S2]MCZ4084656.1 protein phosphatase [Streptomyces sp. H34-S5]
MSKTRQQDHGIPDPATPWDEITPGLWMGGHFWTGPSGERRPAVVTDEFDLVVSLFTRSGHGPGPRAEHVVTELPDAPLTTAQLRAVQHLAGAVSLALDLGLTTLVRCRSGYNRSGLVVAQCLVDRGLPPDRAVALVRSRRSPHALHNEIFTAYLADGLDIAALLAGLDPPP